MNKRLIALISTVGFWRHPEESEAKSSGKKTAEAPL
jgi:hypothetical protein